MGVPFADLSASIVELVPHLTFIAQVILAYGFEAFFLILYSESGVTCMACYDRKRAAPSINILENPSDEEVFLTMLIIDLVLFYFFEFVFL